MHLTAEMRDAGGALPALPYRWDAETEILTGRCEPQDRTTGFTGSVELESPEGAVILLEALGGVLCGVEVVVWPEVERKARLAAPHGVKPGRVVLGGFERASGVEEIDTPISAEATPQENVIHVRFGQATRAVRAAENLLVEIDGQGCLAGLWLLDVPPFPEPA